MGAPQERTDRGARGRFLEGGGRGSCFVSGAGRSAAVRKQRPGICPRTHIPTTVTSRRRVAEVALFLLAAHGKSQEARVG